MPEIYLVRHAQASFGTENYDTLTPDGVQQSKWLGDYFLKRGLTFNHAISGDMQRHIQTLELIGEKLDLKSEQHEVLPGFNEYDFKELIHVFGAQNPEDDLYQAAMNQSDDKKAFYRLLRRVLMAWSDDQLDGAAESWQMFKQRVNAASSTIQQLAGSGQRALIISSGGAISMFVGLVLDLAAEKIIDLNMQAKHTGISRFFFNEQRISLNEFNATPHLEHSQRVKLITQG